MSTQTICDGCKTVIKHVFAKGVTLQPMANETGASLVGMPFEWCEACTNKALAAIRRDNDGDAG